MAMSAEFRSALAAAGEGREPTSRILIIKRAVANELRAVDPAVQAHFTEYFNHSFAPDIVLRWPNETHERPLFVRPQGDPRWLLNDLRLVASSRPLVFTLGDLEVEDTEKSSRTARVSLKEESAAAGAWITDASGTEAMSRSRTRGVALGLLSQAMVRGGKGVSDGHDAAGLAADTEAGFTGAGSLSFPAIRSAVAAIESHLDETQSGRLVRLLRAVWEGHGGDAALFPLTSTIGKLTADDLSYLLKSASEGSEEFWSRIGRSVDTEILGQLQVEDSPSVGLQYLVSGNLETLQAKGIRLRSEPFHQGEPEVFPRWRVDRGCLALRGLNWTAYVAAQTKDRLPPPNPADKAVLPDLDTLRVRAGVNNVPITQVRLGAGDRAVTYESKDGHTVLDDHGLDTAVEDLNITEVSEAIARLRGGGRVEIDFSTRTGTGPTNSRLPLGPLMREVLPLLGQFSEGEQTELHSTLADRMNPELPLEWGPTNDSSM